MLFDYRVIETTYRNRIENEDGPGSLENIVSDTSTRIMWERKNEAEDFRDYMRKTGVSGSEGSADGFIEYSYTLERRPAGTSDEWTFAGNLKVKRQDDDDWYEEENEGGY